MLGRTPIRPRPSTASDCTPWKSTTRPPGWSADSACSWTGTGSSAIAEHLTRHGIPCPSAHDPRRNSHRSGIAWSKGAVRSILTNPRYTGRQVWNKQRKDEVLIDVSDVALGHTTKMRWNDGDQWIYSEKVVHPALVSDGTFAEVRRMLAGRSGRPAQAAPVQA